MSLDNLLKSKSWETQRLLLRLFALEDFDAVYQIYSNFEVMRYIDKGVRTKSEVLVELNSYIKHWQDYNFGPLAVIHKESGKLIGRSGLYLSDRSPFAQLGYVLDLPYHGQGLGVEIAKLSLKYGFEELKLDRIVAFAMPANLTSNRILKTKLRMRFVKKIEYSQFQYNYYRLFYKEYLADQSKA